MADKPASLDLALVIPTLIGSFLSALGAGFILVCYVLLPQKRHFRHALIINLAVSGKLTPARHLTQLCCRTLS